MGSPRKACSFFFAWCAHSILWDSQPASQPQMKVLNPQPWGSNPYECRLILHIDSTDKLLSMLRHGMSWTRNKCQSSFKPVRPALPVRLDSGIKLSWRHWMMMMIGDDWCNYHQKNLMYPYVRWVNYPLVNVYIAMGNHHAINGKIHYFDGHFQ